MPTLLITVGSTLFQPLSDAALAPAFTAALPGLGVTHLVVQLGSARVPDHIDMPAGRAEYSDAKTGLRVSVLRYTADAGEMEGQISGADGVVSHAGEFERAVHPLLLASVHLLMRIIFPSRWPSHSVLPPPPDIPLSKLAVARGSDC
jgi:UDP-N-acetylglucosamine transferase subunit ALG13